MFTHKHSISGSVAVIFGKVVTMIATQGKIIWQAVRSCFGKGYWRDDKPWDDNEGWKD